MRAVELYCGAGGLSHGLMEAGIDVIKAYDSWSVAIQTYRRNVGEHAEVRDLGDVLGAISEIASLRPDLIVGGPPCQDYSLAGKRQEGKNASQTLAFAVIVCATRPEWFLMENVVRVRKSAAWADARELLKRAGYGISESRVDASFYGVPQARKRLFVIGRLGEKDGFIESAISVAASERPMHLRDLFGVSGPTWVTTNGYPCEVDPEPSGQFKAHASTHFIEDAALIANGYVYSRPVRAGRGVRSIDEPFPTVTRTAWEPATPRYLASPHPGDPICAAKAARPSIRQLSQIQGFHPGWIWKASSKRDVLQMIANAVPSPVAAILGREILLRHCGGSAPGIPGGFVQWLVRRGRSAASARNSKAQLARARRMIGGRTFANQALEMDALEVSEEFTRLRKATQSDLRQALRLLAEYESARGKNGLIAGKASPREEIVAKAA